VCGLSWRGRWAVKELFITKMPHNGMRKNSRTDVIERLEVGFALFFRAIVKQNGDNHRLQPRNQ
jgi:hypothetical protein